MGQAPSAGISSGRVDMPDGMKAALFMIFACFCFAAANAAVRQAAAELHPFEVAFFRSVFSLLVLAPWFARYGMKGLRTERLGLYTLRGCVSVVALLAWFYAITLVPLAEAVALSFTAPLFATVLAVVFLREPVRLRRWAATLVGFSGVIVVLRPGAAMFDTLSILVLVSAAAIGINMILVKKLSATESSSAIVAYMGLIMTPLSLIPALFVWQWPSMIDYAWLLVLGGLVTAGHLAFNRSFSLAEATAVIPFDFARLPFTALIAYIAFAEIPDRYTLLGAAIIFGSSLYIAHREVKQRKTAAAPDVGNANDVADERHA